VTRTMSGENGFTLVEVVCVLAIVALLAMVALPAMPGGTSQSRLSGYAVEVATLLKADRNAAIRQQALVSTSLSAAAHIVMSGAGKSIVRLPPDVALDAILAKRCGDRVEGSTIEFFPSGMSCGGTIAIARRGVGFEIRVNWLTGGVEIVPFNKT
jgi:general secretion pathway protein H